MYYLSVLKFEIPDLIPGQTKNIKSEITQLVKAFGKDAARDAVVADFKKQYPNGIVEECRIQDTIIADNPLNIQD